MMGPGRQDAAKFLFLLREAQPSPGKSKMLSKGPPDQGLGGAPGGQKPTTESHIMDILWGRGVS